MAKKTDEAQLEQIRAELASKVEDLGALEGALLPPGESREQVLSLIHI